jgi:hypothetical protein
MLMGRMKAPRCNCLGFAIAVFSVQVAINLTICAENATPAGNAAALRKNTNLFSGLLY